MSGRLDHSKSAIKSLVKPISGQAVVYDVGVGWPPVTTEELAETLGEQSQVIGIDHQLPAYIVIMPKQGTVLFDENDRIINWMDDTIFLDKGIPQKIEKPAENSTDALQPLQRAL